MMAGLMVSGPLAAQGQPLAAATPASDAPQQLGVIVVTAQKVSQPVARVPESITAFTSQALKTYNIKSFDDYATKTPNLSFSYGGGPTGIADARTVAIRGITGQNLFGTAGATGFYIDDTPMPGSIDPRVLDIDNIEVLKGPQGTLFGESSLGGNVRLITKRPNLTEDQVGYMLEAGATSGGGSPDGGAGIIGNIVLSPDLLAVRVVAFGNHDAGYLTRTFPTDPTAPATGNPDPDRAAHQRRQSGGPDQLRRLHLGLAQGERQLRARLRVMYQDTDYHGFPAAFAPLPAFEPDYIIPRAFDVQPDAMDRWALPSLELNYRGNGFSVVSSTSYFYRHNHDLEDSSYGTQAILAGPYYGVTNLPNQPFMWDGERYHNQVTEELRVIVRPHPQPERHRGAVLFEDPHAFQHSRHQCERPGRGDGGQHGRRRRRQRFDLDAGQSGHREGHVDLRRALLQVPGQVHAHPGRPPVLAQTDHRLHRFGLPEFRTDPEPPGNTQSGTDPKVGLAYQATEATMVYASASKGFRAGGAQANLPACACRGCRSTTSCISNPTPVDATRSAPRSQLPQSGPGDLRRRLPHRLEELAAAGGAPLRLLPAAERRRGQDQRGRNRSGRPRHGRAAGALRSRLRAHRHQRSGRAGRRRGLPGSPVLETPAWTATAGAVYTRPLTPATTDSCPPITATRATAFAVERRQRR